MIRNAVISILLLLSATALFPEETRVKASLSAGKVGLEDLVEFTIAIENAEGSVKTPALPALKDLKIYGGPFQSQNISMINFKVSKSLTFTWRLNPLREGTLSIPSIPVQVGEKIFRTSPVKLEAVKGSVNQQRGRQRSPFDNLFDNPSDRRQQRGGEGEVRVRVVPGKRELYVGDSVTLTYELLTQARIQGVSMETPPVYNGFWSESVDLGSNPPPREVEVDGKRFTAYTIRKDILFPSSEGEKNIDPTVFRLGVIQSGGAFGFSRPSEVVRKTASLKLNVKPLPKENVPPGFNGAVGKFAVTSSVDKQEIVEGDAVAFRLSVKGSGNLKTVPPPSFPAIPDCNIYDPKTEENLSVKKGKLAGVKTWEWILVPRSAGEIAIPEIQFTHFDPSARRYVVSKSAPVTLTVSPGEALSRQPVMVSGGEEVQRLGRDINFIVTQADTLNGASEPLYTKWYFYLLLFLPFVGNLCLVLYQKQKESVRGKEHIIRIRKARGKAGKLLKAASMEAERGESNAFFKQLRTAMTGYIADKMTRSGEGLTIEEIKKILYAKGVDEETAERAADLLSLCDTALYASMNKSVEEMRNVLEKTRSLMEELDRTL